MTIDFYTSRTSPLCRAVKMLATHLNITLNEIYVRPYIDTRTEAFLKVIKLIIIKNSLVHKIAIFLLISVFLFCADKSFPYTAHH